MFANWITSKEIHFGDDGDDDHTKKDHCYPVIWIGGRQCPDNMDSSLMNFPSGEQQSLTKSFDLSEFLQYLLSFFQR